MQGFEKYLNRLGEFFRLYLNYKRENVPEPMANQQQIFFPKTENSVEIQAVVCYNVSTYIIRYHFQKERCNQWNLEQQYPQEM